MMKEWDQFFPNACHVCKIYGSKAELFFCTGCWMISYCSKSHQLDDWLSHRKICNHIQFFREKTDLMKFENVIPEQRMQKLKKLLAEVRVRVARPLMSYEKNMFIHRLECLVCFKQFEPAKPLYRCEGCASASFCVEHKMNKEHDRDCRKYKLAFLASIEAIDSREFSICYMEDIFPRMLPHDMTSFLQMYLIPFYNKSIITDEALTIETPWLLRHSKHISNILTVFFAIKKLNFNLYKMELIIHLLATNIIDVFNTKIWEIFLHLAPLKSLQIVMIGPIEYTEQSLTLCKNCIKQNKILTSEYVNLPYLEYKRASNYRKPHIIASLDINTFRDVIHNFFTSSNNNPYSDIIDNYLPPIKLLARINCPYIFTCRDENELEYEKIKINGILREKINYFYCGKNKFAAILPFINSSKRRVSYMNKFIIIYEKFN